MSLSVVIAGRQSQVVTPIGADIPVAILGNQLINPRSVSFKSILFQKTFSDETDFSDMVEFLRTNQDAIMATIVWGGTFYWNFDTVPIFDLSAGSMSGFGGNVNYSAFERVSNWPTATAADCYGDVAFHVAGSGFVDTSPAGQTFLGNARCSWALFQGSAEVSNHHIFINDPGILVPSSSVPYPPLPFTTVGPTVYDSPASPAVQTQYKTLIPTKADLYLTETNTFNLL